MIPVFNNHFYTRLCLEALRESRPGEPRHELIIVDNGSTDDTSAVLALFGDDIHKVLRNDKNMALGMPLTRVRRLPGGNTSCFSIMML